MSQETVLDSVEQKGTLEDYKDIKTEALKLQKEKEEQNLATETNEVPVPEPISEETKKQAQQAEITLESVSVKKESGILSLVLPKSQTVSEWTADETRLLSNREVQTGMGYLQLNKETDSLEDLLFQEYLMQHLNYYQNEKRAEGPSYGVEWVIFDKVSDLENLEAMVNRLLLIREAANTASLCADSEKMAEVRMLADSLSLLLEMPFVKPILEGAIVLAWAYAESLVDVSALMDGVQVPLVKDQSHWQVSFAEIPGALQNPGNYFIETKGISYETYLRIFLMLKSEEEKIQGSMEVIEQSIREQEGKEQFSFDCAIDTVETMFQIRSEHYITFHITRNRSYRTG